MAAINNREKSAEEVRRLFAELSEVYARAAEAVLPLPSISDANAAARFIELKNRASAIIQRIREIEGF